MTDPGAELDAAAFRYRLATRERARARDELAAAVRAAVAAGMSEVQAHKRAGVTRMTVRAWLKQNPGPQ